MRQKNNASINMPIFSRRRTSGMGLGTPLGLDGSFWGALSASSFKAPGTKFSVTSFSLLPKGWFTNADVILLTKSLMLRCQGWFGVEPDRAILPKYDYGF
jgi:hypothetical protein